MQFSNPLIIIILKYFVAGHKPKSSPREAPFEDYGLSFAKKARNVNILMEKGADVKFGDSVERVNTEYFSSGSGKCKELII